MNKTIVFVIFCWTIICGIPLISYAQSGHTHTVVAGETLYGIARNYQIHITELMKANPQFQDIAIKPGDAVNIPAKNKSSVPAQIPVKPVHTPTIPSQNVQQSNPFGGATGTADPQPALPSKIINNVPANTNPAPQSTIKNNQFSTIEHVVQEKQTLYAISKLYNVSVDEIKAWNHLEDNAIKVGSTLLIRSQKSGESLAISSPGPLVESKPEVKPVLPVAKPEPKSEAVAEVKTMPVLPVPVKETAKPASNNRGQQGQLEELYVSARNGGKSLQTSRGTITWIATENAKMSDSFFALHKTAPVGTIVRVTNLVNKRVVFVKVIGRLPDTSDNLNITLRLSSAAKNALLLNGEKAYVDMEFYQ